MSPEKQREYKEISEFVSFFATHCKGISPNDTIHPAKNIQVIEELFGKSKALEGMRQAVNDAIEETRNVNPEYLARLDGALSQLGIITLSELRRRYSRIYKQILKRGSIKGETECYLVKGVLDAGTAGVTSEERSVLQQLSDSYENQLA